MQQRICSAYGVYAESVYRAAYTEHVQGCVQQVQSIYRVCPGHLECVCIASAEHMQSVYRIMKDSVLRVDVPGAPQVRCIAWQCRRQKTPAAMLPGGNTVAAIHPWQDGTKEYT